MALAFVGAVEGLVMQLYGHEPDDELLAERAVLGLLAADPPPSVRVVDGTTMTSKSSALTGTWLAAWPAAGNWPANQDCAVPCSLRARLHEPKESA